MSNKTQLATNNDKLASLIQELANKAAGGGGVETCTVRIYTSGSNALPAQKIEYVCLIDGEVKQIQHNITITDGTYDVTLENVLCNSIVVVLGMTPEYYPGLSWPYENCAPILIDEYSSIGLFITAKAGENAVAKIIDED